MITINGLDVFTVIGILTSMLVAILALGFCYWLLLAELLRFFLRRLKVYKLFVEFIIDKQFKKGRKP